MNGDGTIPLQELIENVPEGVEPTHWACFVQYRRSADGQALSQRNARSRAQQRVHHTAGTKTFAVTYSEMPFPEAYTFWAVHGEQRGMGYGLHLPRTSQVGNQVHQDDPVNKAVRDAFGVQDDNFTAKVQGPEPVFFRNDAAREFFSLMDESDRTLYQGNVDVLGITSRCFP
ncbi:hypothetical protein K1719_022760 [Acacia pycnantha]|nr:hypothetical protein K1719_022760 [Acacia pycnantha]